MRLPVQLLKRKPDTHKGDYGHILIIGGSRGLSGAVCLSAKAALRSGAGLVTVGVPKSLNDIFEIKDSSTDARVSVTNNKLDVNSTAVDVVYATRIDEASATVTYIGKAATGSATSTSVWQVQKIDTTTGTVITSLVHNGSILYNVTVASDDYFNVTSSNLNISSDLAVTGMYQAIIDVYANETITNSNLSNFSVYDIRSATSVDSNNSFSRLNVMSGDKDYWRQWYMLYKRHFKEGISEKSIRLAGLKNGEFRKLTRENIITKVDPDIRIESKILTDAANMRKSGQFMQVLQVAGEDPTADRRWAEKHLAQLSGMNEDEINDFFPPTLDEMIAENQTLCLMRMSQFQ